MGTISIHCEELSIVVPFTLGGIKLMIEFLDLMGKILEEREADVSH